jgi:hypothetical protein
MKTYMNKLVLEDLIKENRDNTNISYILEQDYLFFETGYKVLQNQENNGFIKCVKVSHNGKIKLVYDISKYKSLQSLVHQLTPENFLSIISRVLYIVSEVKHNGFMQCENIDVDLDKIFIDSNNLNVFLIYLPVNVKIDMNSIGVFERELKANLREAISKNSNLNSDMVGRFFNDLQNDNYLLGDIKENMKKNMSTRSPSSDRVSSQSCETSLGSSIQLTTSPLPFEKQSGVGIPIENPKPIGTTELKPQNIKGKVNSKKKGKIASIMTGIFPFRKKKNANVNPQSNIDFKPIYEGGATEVLDEIFIPSIALLGVGTPRSIEVVISKPEFIIGKNPEAVDGVIEFNKAISRVHCKISYVNNLYMIQDLESANGTYVNYIKLEKVQQIQIRVGDKVTIANSEFMVKTSV